MKKIILSAGFIILTGCATIEATSENINNTAGKTIQATEKAIQTYETIKSIYILSMGLLCQ